MMPRGAPCPSFEGSIGASGVTVVRNTPRIVRDGFVRVRVTRNFPSRFFCVRACSFYLFFSFSQIALPGMVSMSGRPMLAPCAAQLAAD